MSFRFFLLAWLTFLLRCSAQGGFSGVWHLVDALSVVCPAGKGSATVTIEKPTSSEYEPHIFTIFRTAKSSVSLSFIAKDATGKMVADQSNGITLHAGTYRRLAGLGSEDTNVSARELWGIRRRMSSGSRRRTGGGGGGGINLNPTTWFSPRRRISTPTYPAASTGFGSQRRRIAAPAAAGAGAAGAANPYGSPRRRGTMAPVPGPAGGYGLSPRRRSSASAATGYGYSSVRRRRTYIAGGSSSYSNPYSSYMGSYGYPSTGYAMSAFGGHTPLSTSYGYSGMNAYQGNSGYTVAMAGGAGLLAGYVGSQLMHPYYHHHGYSWGGYNRQDIYGMPCTSGTWSGSCSSCVSLYGGSSCNVMMSPKIDAARDDLMNTGFAPAQVAWPITVTITHLSGPDFTPSLICPPQNGTGDWQPPAMKQLFLTLTALGERTGADAYVSGHQGAAGASGLFNILLCCCCLGGLYYCGANKSNHDYQFGPDPAGPLPGYQGAYAQPSQNPYWGGAGEGTQLAQSSSSSGGFMTTAAPNGRAWSDYCANATPEIGPNGSLTGKWGECLAWAVVFEHKDKSWEQDPRYQTTSGGPAGSVIEAAVAKVGSARASEVGRAADLLEDECRQAILANRPLPVINQRA